MSSISFKRIRRFNYLVFPSGNIFNYLSSCEIFDLPPINAYHRLLAHKMAEYYRLTHVADSTGASVRYYRGQYARMYGLSRNKCGLGSVLT